MIIAIVQNQDSKKLSSKFIGENVPATKLSSTGGFLRAGNTTFLIGVPDKRVQSVLDIIHETCSTRKQTIVNPPSYDELTMNPDLSYPIDVEIGGATVFVLPIEKFDQY